MKLELALQVLSFILGFIAMVAGVRWIEFKKRLSTFADLVQKTVKAIEDDKITTEEVEEILAILRKLIAGEELKPHEKQAMEKL